MTAPSVIIHPDPNRPPRAFELHAKGFIVENTLSGAQIIHVGLDHLLPVACRLEADRNYAKANRRFDLLELAETRIIELRRVLILFEHIFELVPTPTMPEAHT